jgi:hypothetical protein
MMEDNDEYLESVVKELKEKCIYENKMRTLDNKTKFKYGEEFRLINWNITNINYDINLCDLYCVSQYNYYDYTTSYLLCNECKKILDEKIRIKYNKSNVELSKEVEKLQNQIAEITKLLQTKITI